MRDVDAPLPRRDRGAEVALLGLCVAEMQVRRDYSRVEVNGGFEPAKRVVDAALLQGLQSQLVFEKGQNKLRLGLIRRASDSSQAPARDVRFLPLVLIFLQLLQVDQRGLVVRIELQHLREHRHGPVHETAPPIVEPETEQHVRVLDSVEARPLEERLMFRDGAAGLSLFAVEVAEHEPDLERARVETRGLLQLLDSQIDLIGHQVVQAQDEMRRLADTAPVDRSSFDELVALPGLAGGKADEQRQEHAEQDGVALRHLRPSRNSFRRLSHVPCARRMSSTSSRTAPRPPGKWLIQ